MEKSSIILVAGIGGAIVLALVYSQSNQSSSSSSHATQPMTTTAEPDETDQQNLPPNHPPIDPAGNNGMDMDGMAPPSTDVSVVWKAPASWPLAPNPSTMRLETHKLPPAGSDQEGAELSITRAGGDIAGNVARWTGQFSGQPAVKQTNKTVNTLKVTRVDIEGVYGGGMGASSAHPGWVMLAAIVEGKGQPYFFKVTGPSATVRAGEKQFDAMIDGLTPK